MVVLTAATMNNVGMVLGFILVFGMGSIIGMALISGLVGLPFAMSAKTSQVSRIFRYIAGTLSLIMGVNVIYQIGFADNLLGL
jgi:hypothetical protein